MDFSFLYSSGMGNILLVIVLVIVIIFIAMMFFYRPAAEQKAQPQAEQPPTEGQVIKS